MCKAQGRRFGHHRTFQLATDQAGEQALKGVQLQQRGFFAFDSTATFGMLSERLGQGWRVQWTKLTKNHGWTDFADRLGKRGEDWFLLGGISPSGAFRLYSKEQPFKLDTGWTALIFAPAQAQAKEPEPEAVS